MSLRAKRSSLRSLRILLLTLSASTFLLSGCSAEWRKKFIRKSKNPRTVQAILVLQPDTLAVLPAADRYREHFAFWKSWHGDLLGSFGQNKKRDLANLHGAIGELRSMQELLTGAPAERLKEVLADMDRMRDRWSLSPTALHPAGDRTSLEKIQREVGKTYHYSNIQQTVIPEPEREQKQKPEPSA